MNLGARKYAYFAATGDGDGGNGGGAVVAGAEGTGTVATAGAAGDGDAAAIAAAAAASGTLLPSGTPATTGTDWIPEKYQVKKDDGTVDVEASAKKVTEAHKALETRMGSTGLPPATAEEYVPEGMPDGFDFEEIKADPMYQEFAKDALAAGLNNAQMGLVLKAWSDRAGAVAGEAMGMTVEAAKADLETTWGKENFAKNIGEASGAIAVVAAKAGVTVEQINDAGLGRNPIFLRVMQSIASEFKPDGSTPNGVAVDAADFDSRLATLRADPGYADANHPNHKSLMAQKQALYDTRYPKKTT